MAIPRPTQHHLTGFGLLELTTACAFLVILLGLVVSLARYVRMENGFSALSHQLIELNRRLAEKGPPADLPVFAANLSAEDEKRQPEQIAELARQNADAWSAWLGVEQASALDVWGMPIVLVTGRSNLGMAPRLKPFFLSAGPDGRYFTIADNAYGYDVGIAQPLVSPTTGHSEQ